MLPILYNTFATLASLARIRRMLRHSRLTALTRSDVVNRVIEIELPRYAVMPLDRFQDRSEYWKLADHPSAIPGGSWTTFNWKTNAIGMKTQRVEYADQLRQPQVDVAFDELVCYLMDLGAVPNPHGWKMLRSAGLWTPTGCTLMTSPHGGDKALIVAPLNDSDGHLSLTVSWSTAWITRDHANLPPYWVRLRPAPSVRSAGVDPSTSSRPASVVETTAAAAGAEYDEKKGEEDKKSKTTAIESVQDHDASTSETAAVRAETDSTDRQEQSNSQSEMTCQIGMEGLITALIEGDPRRSSLPESLYIEHLRTQTRKTDGMWFASAATAYGTSDQTILWNYKIPDEILSFSRKDTVPCGILVMLNMVEDAETPEWATKHNDYGAGLDQFTQRSRDAHAAMVAEQRMSPADRQRAVMERMRREGDRRLQESEYKSVENAHNPLCATSTFPFTVKFSKTPTHINFPPPPTRQCATSRDWTSSGATSGPWKPSKAPGGTTGAWPSAPCGGSTPRGRGATR